MACFYLIRSFSQCQKSVSSDDLVHWGTEKEQDIYQNLATEKRRHDWLLGRLTAKELLQRYWKIHYGEKPSFSEIEILNLPSGQPYFSILNKKEAKVSLSLSISHCRYLSLCGLAEVKKDENIGVDLEYVEPRPSLFLETFYSDKEKKVLENYQNKEYDKAITAVWSLKEAALKAIGQGLCEDTKKISVLLEKPPWNQWKSQNIEMDFEYIKDVHGTMRVVGLYVLSWVYIHCQQTGRENC